jgi:hypothetical protein
MSQKIIGIVAATFFAAVPLSAAFADRAPTAYENAEIGNVLFAEGFSSWERIEFDEDDGIWTVHNAVDQDGERRDIKLDSALVVIDADDPIVDLRF